MKKRIALSQKNLPRGLNLQFFAVIWLLLDRLRAPEWVWGVAGSVGFFLFVVLLYDFFTAVDFKIDYRKEKSGDLEAKIE